MMKQTGDYQTESVQNMKGGKGKIYIEHLLTEQELCGAGRLFARMKLKPGDSVGSHRHSGDREICYFLSGSGTVIDDGMKYDVKAGDCNVAEDGHTHEIINTGMKEMVYLAVILYTGSD